MNEEQWWNDTDRGNRSIGRKPCPGAITSATYITRTELGSNPGPARHATGSDQNYWHKYIACLNRRAWRQHWYSDNGRI